MTRSFISRLTTSLSSAFKRLQSIPHTDPELTPENWCTAQPCVRVRLFSKDVVLTQPTSTLFVYGLGLLTIAVGLNFLWLQGDEVSRRWWGISLSLWGIGALLAGTSYQAFGYHIKCAGRETCAWTSWWEVVYLMFQQVGMAALLVAVAYSCTEGTLQAALFGYALFTAVAYVILVFIGGIIPVKSLITFELMVGVSAPMFLMMIVLNAWRYHRFGTSLDLALLGAWALLVLVMAAYWFYERLGVTPKLWAKGEGIWFSENDVLHVGLILWMIYVATVVTAQVRDHSLPG